MIQLPAGMTLERYNKIRAEENLPPVSQSEIGGNQPLAVSAPDSSSYDYSKYSIAQNPNPTTGGRDIYLNGVRQEYKDMLPLFQNQFDVSQIKNIYSPSTPAPAVQTANPAAYTQYAGSPDLFDAQGNYVSSVDWSKNPIINKVNTPHPSIKTEADFAKPAYKSVFNQEQAQSETLKAMIESLPASLKEMYNQLSQSVEKMIESGKTVNPKFEDFTEKELDAFYNEAKNLIDPYYVEQIRVHKKDLADSLRTMSEDWETASSRLVSAFGKDRETQAENEAERGTAFSSGRIDREKNLAEGYTQKAEDTALDVERSAQSMAKKSERLIGSSELSGLDTPYLRTLKFNPSGQVEAGTRRMINLEGGLAGSLSSERNIATRTKAGKLEDTAWKRRVMNYNPDLYRA